MQQKYYSKLILNFNFSKTHYLICSQNNSFKFKEIENFYWVLQFYPLKNNLVLEIGMVLTRRDTDKIVSAHLLFPKWLLLLYIGATALCTSL